MTIREVNLSDQTFIEQWLSSDEEGMRRLGFYGNFSGWFKLLDSKTRWGYVVYDHDIPIGLIDLEKINRRGYFSYYIEPSSRGFGLSEGLLGMIENFAKQQQIDMLEGFVEPDNIASQKALVRAGYVVLEALDEDGMIHYRKTVECQK